MLSVVWLTGLTDVCCVGSYRSGDGSSRDEQGAIKYRGTPAEAMGGTNTFLYNSLHRRSFLCLFHSHFSNLRSKYNTAKAMYLVYTVPCMYTVPVKEFI